MIFQIAPSSSETFFPFPCRGLFKYLNEWRLCADVWRTNSRFNRSILLHYKNISLKIIWYTYIIGGWGVKNLPWHVMITALDFVVILVPVFYEVWYGESLYMYEKDNSSRESPVNQSPAAQRTGPRPILLQRPILQRPIIQRTPLTKDRRKDASSLQQVSYNFI